jgi:hypothetical protein
MRYFHRIEHSPQVHMIVHVACLNVAVASHTHRIHIKYGKCIPTRQRHDTVTAAREMSVLLTDGARRGEA